MIASQRGLNHAQCSPCKLSNTLLEHMPNHYATANPPLTFPLIPFPSPDGAATHKHRNQGHKAGADQRGCSSFRVHGCRSCGGARAAQQQSQPKLHKCSPLPFYRATARVATATPFVIAAHYRSCRVDTLVCTDHVPTLWMLPASYQLHLLQDHCGAACVGACVRAWLNNRTMAQTRRRRIASMVQRNNSRTCSARRHTVRHALSPSQALQPAASLPLLISAAGVHTGFTQGAQRAPPCASQHHHGQKETQAALVRTQGLISSASEVIF